MRRIPGITQSCVLGMLVSCLAACGITTVEVAADRMAITAGGGEFTTITAKVLKVGSPESGLKVTFSTTAGSFSPGSELLEAEASTDSEGKTSIKLYSGKQQGVATVTAQFFDEAIGERSESVSIEFTEASGSSRPVDGTFRLTCDYVNIGALRVPLPDVQVNCRISAQTRSGDAIPGSALNPKFMAEAGPAQPEYRFRRQSDYPLQPPWRPAGAKRRRPDPK